MAPRLRAFSATLGVLWVSGCTFSPGGPFATLEATFTARLDRTQAREVGDGWLKLSSEYQVKPAQVRLELGPIELKDFGNAKALGFDPAHPPPGYTLCHGGHCHRNDGALISYAEIAASLGGGAGPRTAVILEATTRSLFSDDPPVAINCSPSCELENGRLSQSKAPVQRFLLEGTVRDGRVPPRFVGERPLRVELTADAGTPTLTGELDLPADRVSPPNVALGLSFTPGPGVLDEVDFATLSEVGGAFELDADSNASATGSVAAALGEVPLTAEVSRR